MLKTAESCSPLHPDKICDRISDAILDECLKQDPNSRVAVETMGGHGIITITGEITSNAFVDCQKIAKEVSEKNYGVQVNIVKQSNDIANGVDTGGAGDQGIMVGYACRDNEAMIPQELYLARSLCKFIFKEHHEDGKTQITIKDDTKEILTVVASFANTTEEQLMKLVMDWLGEQLFDLNNIKIHLNPAGDWIQSGFEADTGLTGRKLVVDNYGPQIPIGGGAFSGKDATKVDRSGAYMARKIAVDYLKDYPKAKEVLVKLAYSIGIAEPVMVSIYVSDDKDKVNFPIENVNFLLEQKKYNLTPEGIIDYLKLKEPQFSKTTEWGHFGNDFLWDK